MLQNSNKEIGHIRTEPELNFMLLRHWTLYDSLQNSNYVVQKMELWKEPGQECLRRFIASIGCPLDQAKQKYSFMDPKIKRDLKDRVLEKCENFGLAEILNQTFVR